MLSIDSASYLVLATAVLSGCAPEPPSTCDSTYVGFTCESGDDAVTIRDVGFDCIGDVKSFDLYVFHTTDRAEVHADVDGEYRVLVGPKSRTNISDGWVMSAYTVDTGIECASGSLSVEAHAWAGDARVTARFVTP